MSKVRSDMKKLLICAAVTAVAATSSFAAIFNTTSGTDWFDGDNYDPVGVPTAVTGVDLLCPNGAAAARIDAPGAVANNVGLGLWGHPGHLVVGTNGTLVTTAHILMGPVAGLTTSIINNGAITLGLSLYCRGIDTFVNNGTLTTAGIVLGDGESAVTTFSNTGDVTVNGWIHLSNGSTTPVAFNMNGGTIAADKLNLNATGHAQLNLHGGTITLGNMSLDANGGYTIDISGGGKLIVNGDLTGGMNYMASIGLITASDGGTPIAEFAAGKTTLWSSKIGIPYPAIADKVYGPELIANGGFEDISNMVGTPAGIGGLYNITNSFGDFEPFNGAIATVNDWEYYYDDPNGLSTNLGIIRHQDEGGIAILDGTFYLDAFVNATNDLLNINSVMNFRHGVKQVDVLSGVTIDPGATYQFFVNAVAALGYDPESGTLTGALTDGSGTPIVGGTVAGTLDTWNGEKGLAISGDLLDDGQVNVMVDTVGTNDIPGYPTTSTSNNVGSIVAKVSIYEVSLTEVSDPQANDLNRDGVEDILDADLSQSYLDGSIDGGEDAVTRLNKNIAAGMTTNEAMIALNLTEFDYDGNGFFDAADVAALEASFPLIIKSGAMNGSGHFNVEVSGLRIGREYKLMKATDLVFGSFDVEADSVTAASDTETLSDTNSAAGSAFYKVTD